MLADDLRLEELVRFSEGDLNFQGRRLVLHAIHAFAELRKDLLEGMGPVSTRQILTRFGYYWGKVDAAAMDRLFAWENLGEWIKAGSRLHTLQGVARVVVKSFALDQDTGSFAMEKLWHNSVEAEEHLMAVGPSKVPVCWMLAGYASGYVSFCLGKEVFFVERQCVAKGDRICSAVGKDRASWGPEIAADLSYFQIDGVQGKIERLAQSLRQKTRQLAEQRRKLDLLTPNAHDLFIEVHSESFLRALELATRVAPYDSSVLITGETGVGKEVMARHIHSLSSRSKGMFLAINCSALPEGLLESELFGHKEGSFTGAVHGRMGLFEQAHGGTIFLDEIGDISPAMQMKLLRVLQEREVTRVGENSPRKIDVRIISATNHDIPGDLRQGAFREDLYYRLGVVELKIPPLRERKEDILSLARHFVHLFAKKLKLPNLQLDATCLDHLQSYSWPGNVRELENVIERAAVLSTGKLILPEHLPDNVLQVGLQTRRQAGAVNRNLAEVERDHIEAVLAATGGNKTKASRILGISQSTLWRKLKG
ncbi:MAG: sigma 54-interacting transcriptional regulator [Candidatus Latescibacteria bacterium]|nr:sigma 54-interacting transcriptional regulator [Candidatus Latescibacterota bacterium]